MNHIEGCHPNTKNMSLRPSLWYDAEFNEMLVVNPFGSDEFYCDATEEWAENPYPHNHLTVMALFEFVGWL